MTTALGHPPHLNDRGDCPVLPEGVGMRCERAARLIPPLVPLTLSAAAASYRPCLSGSSERSAVGGRRSGRQAGGQLD